MILLSIEAKDDISEVDPFTLEVEFEDGVLWFEAVRLGVRMMPWLKVYWTAGRWWGRNVVRGSEDRQSRLPDCPLSSDEMADLLFDRLSGREELGPRVSREAIRSALDERKMIILEVLES